MIEAGESWELRFGRWQTVLADLQSVDSVICDPPYLRASNTSQNNVGYGPGRSRDADTAVQNMPYAAATEAELLELVRWAAAKTRSWVVVFNDFEGCVCLRNAMLDQGLIVAPVPVVWVKPSTLVLPVGNAATVAKSCEFIAVARKPGTGEVRQDRSGFIDSRGLPGGPLDLQDLVGGKPIEVMRALVRWFSMPNDLVCDPFSGGATTLLASVLEGRRAIGAELEDGRFRRGCERLRRRRTPELDFG